MKLQKLLQTITPFAGISFVIEEFNNCGLPKLIDNALVIRTLSGYQYSDIIHCWFSVFFARGDIVDIKLPLARLAGMHPGQPSTQCGYAVVRDKGIGNQEQNQAGRDTFFARKFISLLSDRLIEKNDNKFL
jgi:hypothetical protein